MKHSGLRCSILRRALCFSAVLCSTPFIPSNVRSQPMWDFVQKQEGVYRPGTFLTVRMVLLGQIRLYQMVLSEQQPDACNFSPSCSHFAYRAITEKGALRGALMAVDRLQRCNPWAWNYHGTCYGVVWVPDRGYKLLDPP